MTEHRDTRKTWRRRWPLLGLVLVLLMLGHDGLMASEALAAPHKVDTAAHHAPISSGHEDALPAHHGSAPLPQHPEQCSIGFVALVRSVNDDAALAHLPLSVVLVAAVATPASSRSHAAAWEEPQWPPGTRRALTQVYRI